MNTAAPSSTLAADLLRPRVRHARGCRGRRAAPAGRASARRGERERRVLARVDDARRAPVTSAAAAVQPLVEVARTRAGRPGRNLLRQPAGPGRASGMYRLRSTRALSARTRARRRRCPSRRTRPSADRAATAGTRRTAAPQPQRSSSRSPRSHRCTTSPIRGTPRTSPISRSSSVVPQRPNPPRNSTVGPAGRSAPTRGSTSSAKRWMARATRRVLVRRLRQPERLGVGHGVSDGRAQLVLGLAADDDTARRASSGRTAAGARRRVRRTQGCGGRRSAGGRGGGPR